MIKVLLPCVYLYNGGSSYVPTSKKQAVKVKKQNRTSSLKTILSLEPCGILLMLHINEKEILCLPTPWNSKNVICDYWCNIQTKRKQKKNNNNKNIQISANGDYSVYPQEGTIIFMSMSKFLPYFLLHYQLMPRMANSSFV